MKKFLIFISGFVFAIIACALIGYFLLKDRTTLSTGEDVKKQNDVHNVQLKEFSANDFVNLQHQTTTKTLINFWASWCKPCIEEMPVLVEYCKRNKIKLILISTDRNIEKQRILLKTKMEKLGLIETYLIKENDFGDLTGRSSYFSFLDKINVNYDKNNTGIPFFILLNEKGKIQKVFNGPNKELLYSSFYDSNVLK